MRRHFPGALRHPKSRAGLGRLPLAGLLGVVLVAGATPAPRASAAPASVRTQTATHSAMAPDGYERRVQHWVNVKRNNRDLRALRIARCTDRSAERWSGHLARTDTFYHQSMRKLLRRCDARYAGETLGRGSMAPRALVRMWMHSDGHRRVLLRRQTRRIGVGARPDAAGRWVVAANFMRF